MALTATASKSTRKVIIMSFTWNEDGSVGITIALQVKHFIAWVHVKMRLKMHLHHYAHLGLDTSPRFANSRRNEYPIWGGG